MSLVQAVMQARRAFDRAARWTCCVKPAVPILFFGDLDAYRASPLRVLTVGLNPSLHEFPADDPFRRFPLAEGSLGGEPSRYLDAMSAYFRTDPYVKWFSAFEPLLKGMRASYYPGGASTALHTDICSPVATNPTWNNLDLKQAHWVSGHRLGCEVCRFQVICGPRGCGRGVCVRRRGVSRSLPRSLGRVSWCPETAVPRVRAALQGGARRSGRYYPKPVRSVAPQTLNSLSTEGCHPMIRSVVCRARRMTWQGSRIISRMNVRNSMAT